MTGLPDFETVRAAVAADPGVIAARDQLAACRADPHAPAGAEDSAAAAVLTAATWAALDFLTAHGVPVTRPVLDTLAARFHRPRSHGTPPPDTVP